MTETRPPQSGLIVFPFPDGPRTVVVVAGESGPSTAASLREQLIGSLGCGTRSLVLDLTDLAVCDPQGVAALSGAVEVAEARGVSVSLRGQSPQVSQLLQTYDHRR